MLKRSSGFVHALFFCLCLSMLFYNSNAQTIFSYGSHSVDKAEFLAAFSRNNADAVATDKNYRDYLDLYIRFKLKVRAALDTRMDTSALQREELASFRAQITDRFMTDQKAMDQLIREAMDRSKKELLLYHIYIAIPAGASEEVVRKATEKSNELQEQLKRGEDFQRLAVLHSSDPEAVRNKGRVGYVTAFVLPYDIENIVFALPEGGISQPYRSSIGIHIFKSGGIREVSGQLKIAHILLSFPPDADKVQEEQARLLADSLYKELKGGADFKDLAFRFSKDNITYLSGGEIADFSTGRYEPQFEEAARSLKEDGAISQPVLSAYGYHIIRRIGLQPMEADPDNSAHWEKFRTMVMDDDRASVARARFLKKIMQETGYKKFPVSAALFTQLTDSVRKTGKAVIVPPLSPNTPLISFGADKTYVLSDWIAHLQSIREVPDGSSGGPAEALFAAYIEKTALSYYSDHLERYNKEFAAQMNEFRDGNLLFEIMQKKIWDVAAEDTAGLRKYYESNAAKYWWGPSADVLIFTSSDESHAAQLKQVANTEGFDWRSWVEGFNGAIQADSGRFELDQLPVTEGTVLTKGMVTSPMVNDIDNNLIFCLIKNMYPEKEPRNFTDARGFVINDYQNYLEDQWVKILKKKYPVKINEEVVRSLTTGKVK